MNHKILVALDSTHAARGVLRAAIAEARWRESDLLLLRAVEVPMEYPVEVFVLSPGNVAEMLEENARNELSRIAADIPAEIPSEVRVEVGTPWRVICNVAKSEDVTLVVIGAHDRRVLDRILGTTASRVVNHIDRSVLIIRG